MFQPMSEPDAVRFGGGTSFVVSDRIDLPERVLAGRLLANGKAIVVGQRGGVFQLDSLRYGDCCELPVGGGDHVNQIAVGTNGMTAILEGNPKMRLEVFQGRKSVQTVPIVDLQDPRQIALSKSNQSVAVGSASRSQVITFHATGPERAVPKSLECGVPLALNSSGSKVACVAPATHKIQYRSALTGNAS